MDVFVERCAGIDVGKVDVKVCVRVPSSRRGKRHQEVRTFLTTTPALLQMRDWLAEQEVTTVGMESTGVYWKPVFYVLEDDFDTQLLNPAHLKKVPGRKSDVTDAMWIAQLVEHGLVRPSFVPDPPQRKLRDLTRYRASLVHERTREAQRLHAMLQDAGIKLDCVASDILGVSGRAMIEAMIGGQRDVEVLADLARTKMRRKIGPLRDALTGRFDAHHAALGRMMLDRIDSITTTIEGLSARIVDAMEPFRRRLERLQTIPGVGPRTAEVIIAEVGAEMDHFASPADLSSWAGMCPGNNESAGKHFTGRTRPGDVWLRAALGEAAAAASHTKHTYLGERFRRLARRRGKKRALVATGRSILEAAWIVLSRDVNYRDLGEDHFATHTNVPRRAQQLIRQLNQLGYPVALPAAN